MRLQGLVCVSFTAATVVLISPAFSRADDLDELRQTLKESATNPESRESAVWACGGKLRTLKELTQALFLQEWRDDEPEPEPAAADRRAWLGIADRFRLAVRARLEAKDYTGKIEALAAVAEAGDLARTTGRRFEFVRGFSPDLLRLIKDMDPGIVCAAARALAHIRPDPQDAVFAYRAMLASEDAEQRIAAAEGLALLVQYAAALARQGRNTSKGDALRAEASIVGSLAVPTAARGLIDDHVEVRQGAIRAFFEAAAAANPPPYGLPSSAELTDAPEYRGQVEAEQTALRPLVLTLQAHAQVVGRALQDIDPVVRQTALHVLEELAHARRGLLDRAASVQARRGTTLAGEKTPAEGMPINAVTAQLRQKDTRVRLAALDILESLGSASAAAEPAVIKELSDKNHFVRWAAARALSKIGPSDAEHAVPRLIELLQEPDLDLQVSAAHALAAYGPAARSALLPLTAALADEHADVRVAALHALDGIGPDAEPALAAVRDALEDRDTNVRKSAARLLGKFGPSARDALNSLRSRLDDSSPAVRTAAQEAMRRIAVPTKER
jgi:HEAT repeat protein